MMQNYREVLWKNLQTRLQDNYDEAAFQLSSKKLDEAVERGNSLGGLGYRFVNVLSGTGVG